jgi:hypothetical protein
MDLPASLALGTLDRNILGTMPELGLAFRVELGGSPP